MNSTRKTTVLLVEDDAEWRAVLERWLDAEGMQARGVARGEWATHAIETHRPDVVLLDVDLPGIDGLRILDMVRRRWPMLPVIVMTAFGGADTRALAGRLGATAYLDKPFRMTDLVAELSRVTGVPGSS